MARVLVTGANGYIGRQLIPALVEKGHQVVALVRSKERLPLTPKLQEKVSIITGDLLKRESVLLPKNIDAAYYLVHSMAEQSRGFSRLEESAANNFVAAVNETEAKQIIYLGGLSSGENVSEHLASRREVEKILGKAIAPLTALHAGIIIGSGSASFEIIRDLVEKLPVMVAPKWVRSLCQPIGINDVIFYLTHLLGKEEAYLRAFDIGGPDTLSYREMLLQLAKIRGLKRWIITVPLLTPHLSSYWLYLVTSTRFSLAKALVSSLKSDAVCKENSIEKLTGHPCLSYEETLIRLFKPSLVVPQYGCLTNSQQFSLKASRDQVIEKLWTIGGEKGWYVMNWAWQIRGAVDQLIGGVGLKRGRKDGRQLKEGDTLDCWRVVAANREEGTLLLYAEMKMPGEAWFEWHIGKTTIEQKATFRPKGLLGRIYWYLLLPIHLYLFRKLCKELAKGDNV